MVVERNIMAMKIVFFVDIVRVLPHGREELLQMFVEDKSLFTLANPWDDLRTLREQNVPGSNPGSHQREVRNPSEPTEQQEVL